MNRLNDLQVCEALNNLAARVNLIRNLALYGTQLDMEDVKENDITELIDRELQQVRSSLIVISDNIRKRDKKNEDNEE